MTDDEGKAFNLRRIKSIIRLLQVQGIACSQAVGELWEGVTLTKKIKFDLRIVEGGKELEDCLDLEDAFIDDVTSERNVTDGSVCEERKRKTSKVKCVNKCPKVKRLKHEIGITVAEN